MSGLTFTSNKYNKTYYYDPISDTTSWNSFDLTVEMRNTIQPPSTSKWELKKSQKYHQDYYYNKSAQSSQWETPRILINKNIVMTFSFDFPWNKTPENFNILLQWLQKQVPNLRYNLSIDNININYINKKGLKYTPPEIMFNVNFLLFNPNSDEIELALVLLKDLDDDGNYPLYLTKAGDIVLKRPNDFDFDDDEIESRSSVVYLDFEN